MKSQNRGLKQLHEAQWKKGGRLRIYEQANLVEFPNGQVRNRREGNVSSYDCLIELGRDWSLIVNMVITENVGTNLVVKLISGSGEIILTEEQDLIYSNKDLYIDI